MANELKRDRLQQHVREMVATERTMEAMLERHLPEVASYPPATDLVRRLQDAAPSQRLALEARLSTIGDVGPADREADVYVNPLQIAEAGHEGAVAAVPRALHALYVACNHAAFGYEILHAVAHRYYDSMDDGNTAGIAEAHLGVYAAAVQEINQLISDAVIWSLGRDGIECQCQCPSCALGVCLCAPHGTITINDGWRETTPSTADAGISVRPPRAGSVASGVGLGQGDRIVAVDNQKLGPESDAATLRAMQTAIRGHQPGEEIRVRVRKSSGDLVDAAFSRP